MVSEARQKYAERVAEAVADEDWQEFRQAMKGLSTERKLQMLRHYYDEGYYHFERGGGCNAPDCSLYVDRQEWSYYQIRIDNYIKALCRGGQLYAGESLETALSARPIFNLRIKR